MKHTFTSFAQLKAQYGSEHISYQILLGTQEWRSKRDVIIKRDGEKCAKCSCPPSVNIYDDGKWNYYLLMPHDEDMYHTVYEPLVLHVHHLYYVQSKYLWEYENNALVTLCNYCHLEVHKTETIPIRLA